MDAAKIRTPLDNGFSWTFRSCVRASLGSGSFSEEAGSKSHGWLILGSVLRRPRNKGFIRMENVIRKVCVCGESRRAATRLRCCC